MMAGVEVGATEGVEVQLDRSETMAARTAEEKRIWDRIKCSDVSQGYGILESITRLASFSNEK
jgi:hypothetical protein